MANIVIDIAAEFTGKNAFKQAETSTDKLSKSLKNVAKTLGVAFSATAVLNYAKASVKAAAADEKAQKQLALALKNVGLGRDVAASEAYIQKLQSEFGVLDDQLRPAYQQLAVATGDTAQSQKLLQIALDISASTGRDLASVTGAISKAYLGNNTALGKLGVGISKADLKAKSFDDIMNQLSDTFAGSATASTNTFQGSMDKLTVASNNASESIGVGLIDAIAILAGDGGIKSATKAMEDFGTTAAEVLVGTASYIDKLLEAVNGGGTGGGGFKLGNFTALLLPFIGQGGILDILKTEGKNVNAQGKSSATGLAHLAELQAKYTIKTLSAKKKLTTEESKALNNAKLKLAIDKANLALGKGSNVFDMEKIQLAAAEKNQAEQLGKVTSQAQLLQITNDLARLEIKQSILALEEAIATGDVKAITAATNKLNADLNILGVLTGQKIKLTEIESILKGILPKDLINLANLNEAIRLLGLIGAGTGTGTVTKNATPILGDPNASPVGIPTALTAADINAALISGSFVGSGGSGGSANAGAYASSGFPGSDKGFNGGGNTTIVVNTGIGDPNAIAEAIDQVLRDATDRGTLRVA